MDAQLKATWDLRFAEIVYEDDTQIVLAYPRHDLPLHAENRPRWSSARWRYELIFLESKGPRRPGGAVRHYVDDPDPPELRATGCEATRAGSRRWHRGHERRGSCAGVGMK
jgi:hypothetical protein